MEVSGYKIKSVDFCLCICEIVIIVRQELKKYPLSVIINYRLNYCYDPSVTKNSEVGCPKYVVEYSENHMYLEGEGQ